ncbi:MAG: 2-aminoethylphosphonate--pyruvate transaminase [Oscillospiraceae bacterium]|jgi:2-aminoethylphosphonate-pyruvate transaminase|nr:2-aminoethylphosphonate--pyruvate transaminase [Oscillospiraceae bacterium]
MTAHCGNNPYLLLTPGPLTTSRTVKEVMLADWCTWDKDYNAMVQSVRKKLVSIAVKDPEQEQNFTAVLMQGSGTFAVESVVGTVMPADGKLLIVENGAYGKRLKQIANVLKINNAVLECDETQAPDPQAVSDILDQDPEITHVAVVHCETTSGILNPIEHIAQVVKNHNKTLIVDAMSSFGGTELYVDQLQIDYMISSANKCIQGVPGFAFVIAAKKKLQRCKGQARSLSLDLYSQWAEMEVHSGKWRFTSPTHVVHAFHQALLELEQEGGVPARNRRYANNQRVLAAGMNKLGFQTMIDPDIQSPCITSFYYPSNFNFQKFYEGLKAHGFIIYPGKISKCDSFRVGTIGEVYEQDIHRFLKAVACVMNQANR